MILAKPFSLRIVLLALVLGLSPSTIPGAWAYEQQIEEQAKRLAKAVTKAEIAAVAVVDFSDPSGRVTELGRFLAEELSGELASVRKNFRVIDRSKLRSLLREHKLAATGLLDPQTTREMGKIAGVDALITGTLTRLATSVHLRINVMDVETADLEISSDVDIPETDQIKALLRQDIEEDLEEPVQEAQGGTAQTVESNGVRFTVPRCERSRGKRVVCSLQATSLDQEKDLALTLGSRALDRGGNEYPAELVQIGQKEGEKRRNRLLVGTPLRVWVTFTGVSTRLGRLQVVDLDCESFRVRFQDVSIVD